MKNQAKCCADIAGICFCGACKLCGDEGCFDLARYLCRLDFVLADMMGMELERTTTIAEGGERCDFRYRRKRHEPMDTCCHIKIE